jgi:hypothetical protein
VAIHLLEANPNKINWGMLSSNPAAIHLLEKFPDKINWNKLCENPAAIHLLEHNQDKFYWCEIFRNPAIFTYDYDIIKETFRDLNKEFIEYYYHPNRMHFWIYELDD